MPRRVTTSAVVISLAIFAYGSTAHAIGKRHFGATRTRTNASTTGTYMGKQVWLPGSWVVNGEPELLLFTHKGADRTVTVRLNTMPREKCVYGLIRIDALKAWGGKALEQSQGRIDHVRIGTLKYRGFTWVMPSTWEGDRHWCFGQDLKTAVEITTPEGDKQLIDFIRNDLLLQLAARQGRAVLSSSSSSSSY